MPRSDILRLRDISSAIEKIQRYASEHPDWIEARDGAVWEAVLYNFAVIGEAAKAVSDEIKMLAPDAAWSPAARMRDVVIHRYSHTDSLVVAETVDNDLPPLKAIVDDLLNRLEESEDGER